jgi:DNA polymerase III subunit gamma/tau
VRTGLGLIGDERAGQLARLALTGDLAGGLTLIASVRDDGLDLRQFQRELVDELRDLLMVKSGLEPAEGATAERLQDLRATVAGVSTAQLLTALRSFGEADLKQDPNSTLPLDIALAECALAGGPEASRQEATPQPGNLATGQPAVQASGRATAPRGPAPRQPPPEVTEPSRRPTDRRAIEPEPVEPAAGNTESPAIEVRVTEPLPAGLTAARERMRAIYEKARASGFQLGALLNSGCDIIEADETGVVLGFRHEIHASKASEKPNLEALTAIVTEVMGRTMRVRCVQQSEVTPWTQRDSASRSPLVRAAQEMGARILSSEPED